MTMREVASHSRSWGTRLAGGNALPMLAVLLALLVLWYAGTVWLNAPLVIDRYEREGNAAWTVNELVDDTMAMERPVLPAPHQILAELDKTVLEVAPTSR
ncbi:MAG TPA: ABC transporter permease, partial [Stellaceae bacterium]|nr:ABC transporter permease [Stellaceae bacterium]